MKLTLVLTFIPLVLLAVPVGPTLENPKIKGVSSGSASNTTLLKVDPSTGVLSYITATATSLGLGNVDNTSDVDKPVSAATQTALNLKANTANPSFTGSVSLGASVPLNLGAGSDIYFGSAGTLYFDAASGFVYAGSSADNHRTALGLGTLATQSGTFSGTSSGTNTGDQTITLTGDVTGSGTGSFATTIGAGKVTLANMANMATASLIYRKTAGAGAPEVNTLATLKTDLGLTGTNSGDQTSIVGITGTTAQFNTALSDNDFATLAGSESLSNKTFVTPVLGTPTSGTLSNCTGLPISSGVSGLGASVSSFLGSASSSNLKTAVTDETGSGELVFSTAPLFKTTINLNNPANTFKYVITPAAITTADKILNLPLITATDTLATLGLSQTFTSTQYFNNSAYALSGTGVFSNSGANYIGIRTDGTTNKLYTTTSVDISISPNDTPALVVKASNQVVESKGGWMKKVTVDATTSITLTSAHHVVTCSNAGAVTCNLPAGVTGTEYIIKNKGAGTVTVTPNGTQKLFNTAQVATYALTTGKACTIIFDGTDWSIVADF